MTRTGMQSAIEHLVFALRWLGWAAESLVHSVADTWHSRRRHRHVFSPTLRTAIQRRDRCGVEHLLAQGNRPNGRDRDRLTPLHVAARAGDCDIARLLLERGADVNARSRWGETPLHVAIRAGQSRTVALLLESGARVGATTAFPHCDTALHLAAKRGDIASTRILVKHGADANARNAIPGITPLQMGGRHAEIVALLKHHGATAADDIYRAVWYGHVDSAISYLVKGGDVNAKHRDDVSLLHVAAQVGRVNIAALLLARGAEVDIRDRHGNTPLAIAARCDRPSVVALLLSRGASVNCRNRQDMTPLYQAAVEGHRAMAARLIVSGAAIDLSEAALLGQHSIVRQHLDNGGDVRVKLPQVGTLLHAAARNNDLELAQLALDRGINIDERTPLTPLHVAARNGHILLAEMLLARGAAVNRRDRFPGFTPLHFAAMRGDRDMVELLVTHGAKVKARTWWPPNLTPLKLSQPYPEVERLLVRHGAR
ncbi:MAG: ankyrin repeat domain-containing protein [Cyanobacteria bacterium J06639_1]